MRILISAGEASGEMYGAQLIEALRRLDPSLEFFGVGGDRMRAAGCDTIVDAKDLAVVGITEILSHLPKILGLYKNLIREADRRREGRCSCLTHRETKKGSPLLRARGSPADVAPPWPTGRAARSQGPEQGGPARRSDHKPIAFSK